MARTDPISRLLTVAEVANVIRVSRMTVYRLIRRGQLKAIRVGRNYRVREDDLNDYLEAQAVTDIGRVDLRRVARVRALRLEESDAGPAGPSVERSVSRRSA